VLAHEEYMMHLAMTESAQDYRMQQQRNANTRAQAQAKSAEQALALSHKYWQYGW
jgi:hypothetical protein